MNTTTTARRELLLALLSSAESGLLLPSEAPLLRPLIEAEMAEPDAVRAEARIEYEALMGRFNDLRTETRRQGDVHERTAARNKQYDAAIARVLAAMADPIAYGPDAVSAVPVDRLRAALHTPSDGEPAPVVACTCNPRSACDAPCDANQAPAELARCSPLVNPDCPGHQAPPYCERAPSSPTMAPPLDWTPTDDLVTADAPSEPQP